MTARAPGRPACTQGVPEVATVGRAVEVAMSTSDPVGEIVEGPVVAIEPGTLGCFGFTSVGDPVSSGGSGGSGGFDGNTVGEEVGAEVVVDLTGDGVVDLTGGGVVDFVGDGVVDFAGDGVVDCAGDFVEVASETGVTSSLGTEVG